MPNRNRNRVGGQPDFEIAYYTKELGKTLQRKMLREHLAQFSSEPPANGDNHGEDSQAQADSAVPPPEDRAG
jgi:hypothetical protein